MKTSEIAQMILDNPDKEICVFAESNYNDECFEYNLMQTVWAKVDCPIIGSEHAPLDEDGAYLLDYDSADIIDRFFYVRRKTLVWNCRLTPEVQEMILSEARDFLDSLSHVEKIVIIASN